MQLRTGLEVLGCQLECFLKPQECGSLGHLPSPIPGHLHLSCDRGSVLDAQETFQIMAAVK